MRPTNWKETAEILGVVAIVLSLVFVGLETRNGSVQAELNTRALEMTAYQQLIESISEMNKLSIEEPEIAEASRKLQETPDELSRRERNILTSMMWLRFRHGDMAYFQFQRGAIDESRLRSALGPLLDTLGSEYAQDFWERNKRNFVPAYRDYIDSHLANIGAAQSN